MHQQELHYIRLFPLTLVLFPGISIPLHIFEERYKQMINECIDTNDSFGIVFTRQEEEANSIPGRIGTSAQVMQVDRLAGGRMNIIVEGQKRFRILDLLRDQPYLGAYVEFLPVDVPEQLDESALISEVSVLFKDYVRKLVGLTGHVVERVEVPSDVELLASMVASLLAVPIEQRQDLLEELNVQTVLQNEVEMLRQQLEKLSSVPPSDRPTAEPMDWNAVLKDISMN